MTVVFVVLASLAVVFLAGAWVAMGPPPRQLTDAEIVPLRTRAGVILTERCADCGRDRWPDEVLWINGDPLCVDHVDCQLSREDDLSHQVARAPMWLAPAPAPNHGASQRGRHQ